MTQAHSRKRPKKAGTTPLMVRLDDESKTYLSQAAESDYVRTVTVAQAQREVLAARDQTIVLTADEQLAFWNALNETPRLTIAQRRLGSVMRGES